MAEETKKDEDLRVGIALEIACQARIDRNESRDKWHEAATKRLKADDVEESHMEAVHRRNYFSAKERDILKWKELGSAIGESPAAIARLADLVPQKLKSLGEALATG